MMKTHQPGVEDGEDQGQQRAVQHVDLQPATQHHAEQFNTTRRTSRSLFNTTDSEHSWSIMMHFITNFTLFVLGNKVILLIDLFLFGYLPMNLVIVINTEPKWSRVQWKVMMELHQCFGVLLPLRRVGTLYWWRQACVYLRSQQTSTAKQAEDGVWVDH